MRQPCAGGRRPRSFAQGLAFDVAGYSPRIEIFVNGRKVKELQCFAPRLDVKQAFPDVPHALYCGFDCTLRVGRSWAPRSTIKVTASSQAGTLVLAERQ